MTALTTTSTQLPAHLAALRSSPSVISKNIMGGIRAGKSHPKLSIRTSRFRLTDANGVEEVWKTLTINLILLDANPFVSKRYYAKAYDSSSEEAVSPDCFSDNGVSPSPSAASPQCTTCAACPQNVWGSKITPTGSKVRACGDSKRLAVLAVDTGTDTVYELSVPGTSMKELHEVITKLDGQGIPAQAVVFEVGFDDAASYPKLKFRPVGFINEEQAELVQRLQNGDAVKEAIGTAVAVPAAVVPSAVVLETPAPTFPTHTFQPVAVPAEEPAKKPRKAREPVQQDLPLPVPKAAPAAMEVAPAPTSSDLDAKLEELFANVKL